MKHKQGIVASIFLAFLTLSIAAMVQTVMATTWYVYPGSGTPIQDAIDGASAEDTIIVHAGTYLEALYINKSLTLKALGTVVVRGAQSFTTNYYGAAYTREAVIFVVNATNVVIEGFNVEGNGLGPGRSGVIEYIYSGGRVSSCTIDSNTVGDMNALGIEARGSGSMIFKIFDCTIKEFGRVGAYFVNCTGGISYSEIIGQTYSAVGLVNYGIEVESHQGICDIEIMHNQIYGSDNTYYPEPTWSSAGIIVDTWREYDAYPNSTVAIECNDIYDNYFGIEVVSNPQLYAHCNNIYDNRIYGVISASDYLGNNETFDATQNWWGDASGPTHSSNPTGTGDPVSDYVLFDPWLRSLACQPVGGVWVPINKFELLAPWIGLALLIVATAASVGYVERRKRKQI